LNRGLGRQGAYVNGFLEPEPLEKKDSKPQKIYEKEKGKEKGSKKGMNFNTFQGGGFCSFAIIYTPVCNGSWGWGLIGRELQYLFTNCF
jgi:hypothetical protein